MAKAAGADAVKLQTYTADTITIDHDGPGFVIEGGLWHGRRLYELYQEAHTPWAWHEQLFAHAREIGIACFSSPFDPTAVAFLEGLCAPAYKVASMARTGKPLIISTGLATPDDIAEAVAAAREAGGQEIVLLHCTSGYPTPPAQMHLRTMMDLGASHGALVGLSDHTMGTAVSVAAVALGACVIEKHFTLARADGGPDAAFSLEPDELARLVADCRAAWEALGQVHYEDVAAEAASRDHRRSLYAVADIKAGEPLSDQNIRSIRPGHGLPPKHWRDLLGRTAARDIKRGEPLAWDLVR
jgi:pseudaminic acid synthase